MTRSYNHAFVTKSELESAIRTRALDMLWENLGPTLERILARKKGEGTAALKLRALQLLWEIGRDPTTRIESKTLQAKVDATTLKGLLEADPALRKYLEQNPDVQQRLLPGSSALERRDASGNADDVRTTASSEPRVD